MKKIILNFIEVLLTIIILLVCITSVIQSNTIKEKHIFNYGLYTVEDSLSNKLSDKDIVLIKEINYNEIKQNDIIAYYKEDKLIINELNNIDEENGKIVLKSENNSLAKESLYGKIAYKFILLSLISNVIRNKLSFVLCLLVPTTILLILELIGISKERKRKSIEEQMQEKIDKLNKIKIKEKDKELKTALEENIKSHLEEISSAKRDFKKIDLLEETIQIPLEEIQNQINILEKKLGKENKKTTKKEEDLDKTIIISNSQDIKEEIKEELEIKKTKKSKTSNKENKKQNNLDNNPKK